MKNAPTGKTNKSALNALTSALIVLVSSPATQQAFALLALMLLTLSGVAL